MKERLSEQDLRGKRIVVSEQDDSPLLRIQASFYGIPVIVKRGLEPGTGYLVDFDKLFDPEACAPHVRLRGIDASG